MVFKKLIGGKELAVKTYESSQFAKVAQLADETRRVSRRGEIRQYLELQPATSVSGGTRCVNGDHVIRQGDLVADESG